MESISRKKKKRLTMERKEEEEGGYIYIYVYSYPKIRLGSPFIGLNVVGYDGYSSFSTGSGFPSGRHVCSKPSRPLFCFHYDIKNFLDKPSS